MAVLSIDHQAKGNLQGELSIGKMSTWSPDNAISAYLQAMKMRTTAKEPDVAEFISALAAGNSAKLMVVACASYPADSGNHIVLALEAAAQQTGGAVVCILPNPSSNNINTTIHDFSVSGEFNARHEYVKFVIGDAETLLMNDYKEADCIVIDCNLENCEAILEKSWRVMMRSRNNVNTIVVAFNAGRGMGSWKCSQGLKNAHFLPIGEGLLVSKKDANLKNSSSSNSFAVYGKKNRWLTKIDKYTGEEHVFRV